MMNEMIPCSAGENDDLRMGFAVAKSGSNAEQTQGDKTTIGNLKTLFALLEDEALFYIFARTLTYNSQPRRGVLLA